MKENEWITSKEACLLTGYSMLYLRRLLRQGKINSIKVGREWKIEKISIEKRMEETNSLNDGRRGARPWLHRKKRSNN
jgi:excisionase family DNA binding protein